jgi:hypothetical protein
MLFQCDSNRIMTLSLGHHLQAVTPACFRAIVVQNVVEKTWCDAVDGNLLFRLLLSMSSMVFAVLDVVSI